MAMLKTDKDTHTRFMRYVAKRFIQTENKMTVTEALNELLDYGDQMILKQRDAEGRFDRMPEDVLKKRMDDITNELLDQK
jgi:hypothetical protein